VAIRRPYSGPDAKGSDVSYLGIPGDTSMVAIESGLGIEELSTFYEGYTRYAMHGSLFEWGAGN
jgi:hypothetical protein